ncbi:phosphate starvation-inducible protein PhoH [Paenibacillus sp. 79R4]|uniref:phosphate starvation-inducible protein PhoH n=1 Tax=Paenibacillus sp. 79R4 TaxID=2212847 RepID=UPI0015B85300|nr:phosphate starvation-inducible protein PhoH [Paenibacillus sp. 79R4]NWL89198.1 phosphate starvation-inducible protein PhoH [Paenibacillus sp. 79R4]
MNAGDLKNPTDLLLLNSGTYFSTQTATALQQDLGISVLDMYSLPDYDLSAHKFLVIDNYVDQELMNQHSGLIGEFLDQGKILVFSGNLFLPWLPGGSLFVPKTIRDHQDYTVTLTGLHSIFEGVNPDDLTYNKGVSGFFARGHHPIPPHAEVLLTLPGGEPITYIDRHSTKGTILVHSGNNLLGYTHSRNTSGRIGAQLIRWLYEEYEQMTTRSSEI